MTDDARLFLILLFLILGAGLVYGVLLVTVILPAALRFDDYLDRAPAWVVTTVLAVIIGGVLTGIGLALAHAITVLKD